MQPSVLHCCRRTFRFLNSNYVHFAQCRQNVTGYLVMDPNLENTKTRVRVPRRVNNITSIRIPSKIRPIKLVKNYQADMDEYFENKLIQFKEFYKVLKDET